MQALDPLNLFRITWHNDPRSRGFGAVNALEIPSADHRRAGADRRPRRGSTFRPAPTRSEQPSAAWCRDWSPASSTRPTQRAVWPSTGNYCRGGAFDCALLGCASIAILPEEMSRERFEWLERIGAEIIATPGCESNVKEIFDACWEIRGTPSRSRDLQPVRGVRQLPLALRRHRTGGRGGVPTAWRGPDDRLAGLGGRDRLGRHPRRPATTCKQRFPGCRITAAEALQCPTLLHAGFGGHRIEGIGDKHVPWIHNVRNTDLVTAIDDEATMRLLRLFNEPAGRTPCSLGAGCPRTPCDSCRCSASRRSATCWPRSRPRATSSSTSDDVVLTSFTDSVDLYRTRLGGAERTSAGAYSETAAEVDLERCLLGATTDHLRELTLPRPQGDPQPQVLHLGRAAGAHRRRARRALEPGVLARPAGAAPRRGTRRSSPSTKKPGLATESRDGRV